jgi:hypothetical protein
MISNNNPKQEFEVDDIISKLLLAKSYDENNYLDTNQTNKFHLQNLKLNF